MATASRNYLVDIHPDCYNVALLRGWAKRIMSLRGVTDELDEAIFDFAAEVRGAAHSARLPLEIIRIMKASFESMIRDKRSQTPTEKLANYMTVNLGRKIPSLTIDQLKEVRGVCLDLNMQFRDLREDPRLEFPLNQAWEELLKTGQFKLVLWSLQRTSYVAVYNSYESFSMRCLALAINHPSIRRGSPEKFAKTVREAFGDWIFAECYDDEAIRRAGLLRHALSHAAGKKTRDLEKFGFLDRVVEGRVQVTATDVRELLELVQDRGFKLAEAAATKLSAISAR